MLLGLVVLLGLVLGLVVALGLVVVGLGLVAMVVVGLAGRAFVMRLRLVVRLGLVLGLVLGLLVVLGLAVVVGLVLELAVVLGLGLVVGGRAARRCLGFAGTRLAVLLGVLGLRLGLVVLPVALPPCLGLHEGEGLGGGIPQGHGAAGTCARDKEHKPRTQARRAQTGQVVPRRRCGSGRTRTYAMARALRSHRATQKRAGGGKGPPARCTAAPGRRRRPLVAWRLAAAQDSEGDSPCPSPPPLLLLQPHQLPGRAAAPASRSAPASTPIFYRYGVPRGTGGTRTATPLGGTSCAMQAQQQQRAQRRRERGGRADQNASPRRRGAREKVL